MNRGILVRVLRASLILCLLLPAAVLSGGDKKPKQDEPVDTSKLVWPQPPQRRRIAFVTQITGVDDVVGVPKRSWMDRAAGAKPAAPRQALKSPYGVAVDSKRQVYVADAVNHTVFVFNLEQKQVERRGDRAPARMALPIGLAIDERDRLFVSDAYLHQITCFSPAGEVLAVFGMDDLQRPAGIALDTARHRLYVADAKANKLVVFDANTFRLLQAVGGISTPGKAEPGKFSAPSNVAVGADGKVLVTDTWNQRVQVFDADGKFVRAFGHHGVTAGDFVRPKGIALDSEGHVYVADAEFNNFQILTSDGRPLLAVGDFGTSPGQFALIAGMAIDKSNRIYVTDQWRGRLQVFQYFPEKPSVVRTGTAP
jgi:DNA-binding beta-propeller fold protein YncE